jgi:predicted TIM-barrel fold metal-dependent hydrolase
MSCDDDHAADAADAADATTTAIAPVDSHLHVYSDGRDPVFPLATAPPPHLADAQPESGLWAAMCAAGVAGALIVQPINHQFDHRYVAAVMADPKWSGRFKGMCLLDPMADDAFLPQRRAEGFVGVRFNPYLFAETEQEEEEQEDGAHKDGPSEIPPAAPVEAACNGGGAGGDEPAPAAAADTGSPPSAPPAAAAAAATTTTAVAATTVGSTSRISSSSSAGSTTSSRSRPVTMRGRRATQLFRQAGELGMPVGFMCFKGLHRHVDDIVALMTAAPRTPVVLDHWGFFLQDGKVVEEAFQQLLALVRVWAYGCVSVCLCPCL